MNSKSAVETLIKAGSMESVEPQRARLLAGIENAWSAGQKASADRKVGQSSMFGGDDIEVQNQGEPSLPSDYKPLTSQENMAFEKELLGVYLTDHPLDRFSEKLQKLASHTVEEARHCGDREPVKVAGVLSNVRPYYTKGKNEQMYFLTLEDKTGSLAVTLFPRGAVEFGPACIKDSVVLITGRVSYRDRINTKAPAEGETSSAGSAEIVAESIIPVASAQDLLGAPASQSAEGAPEFDRLHIRLSPAQRDKFGALNSILSSHEGTATVRLHLTDAGKPITIEPKVRVSTKTSMVEYIKSILGNPDAVWTE